MIVSIIYSKEMQLIHSFVVAIWLLLPTPYFICSVDQARTVYKIIIFNVYIFIGTSNNK